MIREWIVMMTFIMVTGLYGCENQSSGDTNQADESSPVIENRSSEMNYESEEESSVDDTLVGDESYNTPNLPNTRGDTTDTTFIRS